MADNSMELRCIYNDKNYKLFDFPYPFYDEELKSQFEAKFFEWFMFDEIGFPTPGYFKQRLKAHLHVKMPYYNKLYQTELEAKGINFLLNKDLKETFIRELENNNTSISLGTNKGTNNSKNEGSNNTENNSNINNENITINSDTPQGSISDIENYMSTASKDKNNVIQSNNSIDTFNGVNNSTFENTLNANNENTSKGKETTELISQGNIGITSSAELLEKWRNVLINIDELILNDLNCLFMQTY